MSFAPGIVVRIKPDSAYKEAVLATKDCTGERLCPDNKIPQGCQDTSHLLMVVKESGDDWVLCPLSGFPHSSGKEVPTPEYIGLGEADIINHPTYLHVGLQTIVAGKYIYPRPHPRDVKAKASFRGERLNDLLKKVRGHWGEKGRTPSDGSLKSINI